MMVQRNNHGIYLTKGWHAMRDFYKLSLGTWITLVFEGFGKFNIRLRNRFGTRIRYPKFCPPVKFLLTKMVPMSICSMLSQCRFSIMSLISN
jgi:hypothetical protein